MPRVGVNGIELFYEVAGDGDPLVLVHGSWSDHAGWAPVLHALALRFRVLVYDRRGHSQSERPPGRGTRFEDEEDLAALIETLGFAPAYVAGNSFGASTALGLAARRPELVRGLVAHEPPLMGIVADDRELLPLMAATGEKIESVLASLRAGERRTGARRFVEEVALGPGAWDQLPEQLRETFITNAPTFMDEQADPQWAHLDLDLISGYTGPVLLTKGTASPPWFATIAARLSAALPQAETHTFQGAGHLPHISHPAAYVKRVTSFIEVTGRPSP
ncbi:alpha/beta fold hydrolase [Kitasatospora sp. NPDC056651]|uniref:alpha/beta fold hydrolase n=1 Tax=Kitasatospora sp. NPDC056651 TaxID=3345892 RepID=UPI0036A8406C